MSTLPGDGLLADAGDILTTANAKTALEQLRDCAAESPGGAATSELTISSGSVTPTGWLHSIDTEGGAGTDDLTTIDTTNHPDGRILLIYPESGARTVVVKDESGGAGQIHTADGEDFSMDEADKLLFLMRRGADWYEITRNFGYSVDDFRIYLSLGTAATKNTGVADGNVPLMDATGYPAADGSQITDIKAMGDYICLQDQKANDTAGGTFTSGAWRTRDLNIKVADTGGDCTLAANQFTLAAGTYYIRASAPAYCVEDHKIRLHETTSTLSDIIGTSEFAYFYAVSCYSQTRSFIVGTFTVTPAHVTANQNIFEIQHRCTNTYATHGLGNASGFGVIEVYTIVELWKL
jgi:hypothetical protein